LSDSAILAKYRQRILQETRSVKLSGVPLVRNQSGSSAFEFPLNHLYIRIQALQKTQEPGPEDTESQTENYPLTDIVTTLSQSGEELYRRGMVYRELERPDPIDPENALHQNHRLVILGAPGSGKSILLQYLARKTAADPNSPIPILICLREYTMYLYTRKSESLYDFAINGTAGEDSTLRQALKNSDRILWLIDHLDEAYPFRNMIIHQLNQLPGDVILTSRPIGYQKVGLETFAHFEILTMSSEEVAKFLRDWFILLSKQTGRTLDWVEERTRWLETELARRPHIQKLAGNPLLLTSLIILSGEQRLENFPEHRMDIHTCWVESLLDSWDNYRCSQHDSKGKITGAMQDFSEDFVHQVILPCLYYVGWHVHIGCYEMRDNHHFAQKTLVEALHHYLDEQRRGTSTEWKEVAEVVLEFWQQVGMLEAQTIDNEEYLTFRHSTFREYATAQHIAESWEKDFRRTWKFLASRLHHYAWREPILMMAGLLDQQHLDILVSRLLRGVSAYEHTLHRDLRLSDSLLGESRAVKKHLAVQIIRRLSRLSHDHSKKRLATLILIYVFGFSGLLGMFITVQGPFSWIFILTVSILWTLVWVAAFVTYEVPELQKILAFPLRLWNYLPNRELVIQLLGQSSHAQAVSSSVDE
jgi:hypothetical protein